MSKKKPSRNSNKKSPGRPCRDIPLSESDLGLFYHHIRDGSRTAAKRVLSNIHDGNPHLGWTEGYFIALEGMVLSLKDQRSLLNRVSNNGTDKKYLLELYKQFRARTQSPLSHVYDQGYFSAWMDLFQTINELPE